METSISPAISTESTTATSTPTKERKTLKIRLLLLSDTHTTTALPPSNNAHAYRHPLPEADVLLHAGDLTERGYKDEYEDTIDMLASHPAELKLVIAGNHDITLDETYVLGPHGQKHAKHTIEDCRAVREMWSGPDAVRRGIRYLEEGTHSFELKKGAKFTVYASPHQPVFDNWAFNYPRSVDRFNPRASPPTPHHLLHLAANPIPDHSPPLDSTKPAANPIRNHPAIDILLTHGPPMGVLDVVAHPPNHNVGCAHLLRACERARPLLHVFGHIHEGWGAARLDWESGVLRPVERDAGGKEEVLRERGVPVDLSGDGDGDGGETEGVKWGRETVFVNASIMDVRYRPVNAPWVVDLDLPVRG